MGDDQETGAMWECPLLVDLGSSMPAKQSQHLRGRSSFVRPLSGPGHPSWMNWDWEVDREDHFQDEHSFEGKYTLVSAYTGA